jgi:hypothetical protein
MFQDGNRDWVYRAFCTNLKDHIANGKVVPLMRSSLQAALFFTSHHCTFDMTFIDASHDYGSVKADILAWLPITTKLICGHDAGHPPIMAATEEIFGDRRRHEHSMWVVDL